MKRLLCLLAAAALLFSSAAAEKALPRVELVSQGDFEILDLNYLSPAFKDVTVDAQLSYTDQVRSFTYPVLVKLQGGYTLEYDKKNYTIKFYTDDTYEKKQKVSVVDGWGKHAKYVLKANYQDATKARNIVGARLAAAMNRPYGIFPEAPNCGQVDGFPVELYVDGAYWGLYTWNIPKDGWMFDMDKKNENHLLMTAEQTSVPAVLFTGEASGEHDVDWDLKQGPEDNEEAIAEAYEKLNRAIRFVMNSTDEEFHDRFGEYFNLDAALNYYCFLWYTNTSDNMAKNMLLATLDGAVWTPILYDLDTCFGLYFAGSKVFSPLTTEKTYQGRKSLLWKRMKQLFARELSERYFELRETVFNEAYVMSLFEAFESQIPDDAWQREHERWPDAPGQEFLLESIRQHIREREPFVDGVFAAMAEKSSR